MLIKKNKKKKKKRKMGQLIGIIKNFRVVNVPQT